MKPLAAFLRPKTIDDIVGQDKLLSPNGMIRRMVDNNFASNLIFFGPPGVGKTSFAIALANDLGLEYETFNASIDKKEKIDKIFKKIGDEPVVLIIDEVHRMNQQKQDLLLEYMEEGKVIIFFTTTENPYFIMNPAIRSRSTILELKQISPNDIFNFLKKKISNGQIELTINDEQLKLLSELAGGDLRVAINKIEILSKLYKDQEITFDIINKIFDDQSSQLGSRYGDTFHDLKSALQKSVRGSDVDAALYYFARMIALGDIEPLMRRMVVMAYEDIGIANPAIPPRVFQATQAFRQIGLPEGIIPLGLAIVEMALSEKSNSAYMATQAAVDDVQRGAVYDIPDHLKDGHYKSATKLGRSIGYKYAHNYPNDYVEQQYLPNEIKDKKYYNPKMHSIYENKVNTIYNNFKKNTKK